MTRESRVFYVAYKWVQKYWPHRVGRGSDVCNLPGAFWVDGVPIGKALSVKIRLYNKAAHMIVSE